jgi:predicted amidohydrolase YtcJ
MLLAEAARLNRAGLMTRSENGVRSDVPSDARPAELLDNGDDTVRQVGIKIWVDGSQWIGNIDLSFQYLDSDATRTIGVVPGSCGHANYTSEQLTEIVEA